MRLWDLQTELPEKTLEGHLHWVLCEYRNYKNMHLNNAVHAGISWSPNGKKLASACKLGKVFELYIKILNSIHKIFFLLYDLKIYKITSLGKYTNLPTINCTLSTYIT